MGDWLLKVFHALSFDSTPAVRLALEQAREARTKIVLEVTSKRHTMVLSSTIEQLRTDDFVISQPSVGGLTQPLAFGEFVKIGFVQGTTYYTGETRCLGRIKVVLDEKPTANPPPLTSDYAGPILHGYRMAYPQSIRTDDRRSAPRAAPTLGQPVPAQLYASASLKAPLIGTIVDVSMTGARFLAACQCDQLQPNQQVFLKAMFPPPVGLVDDLVTITRIEADGPDAPPTIGVRFQNRIPALDQLLRAA